MLRALSTVGDTLVATRSANARALPADELASARAPHFAHVDAGRRPRSQRCEHARRLAGPDGAVLVTGSLYLLAELSASEEKP